MPYIPYSRQAVIGYDNVFARGTLSASSETPDTGEAANAVDGLSWDHWQPAGTDSPPQDWLQVDLGSAAAADYLAINAHNLGSQGATITPQGSADGVSWTAVGGPFSPTEDKPYFWRFDSASYRYWRVLVEGTGLALGIVQAGVALVLPEGVYVGEQPAPLNRKPKLSNNESEGGQFLGRTILRQGSGVTIAQEHVFPDWVRETWMPFAKYAETNAFFFAWRSDDWPEEVIFGWSEGGATAKQSHQTYMSVSLDIKGQIGA